MCGFLASLAPALRPNSEAAVAQALHQRGPDAHGIESGPGARFIHTRLSIVGLGPEGVQPARSADGRKILVFNGEIYNFRELAAANGLGKAVSDTQVLLQMLMQNDAADVIGRLRGMYAFAYWDEAAKSLIAVRDPMGIKPLYLHEDDRNLPTLASCLPALLANGSAPAIDAVGLLEYVAFGHTGPSRTVYHRINKLLPGLLYQWRIDTSGGVSRQVHAVDFPADRRLTVADALRDSIRAHLISDVEVGTFLSGGIDSTLLTALAARELGGVRTFTVSFPESPARDESALAEWNANLIGSAHETVPATARSMAGAARPFLRQQGEPFGDAACLPLTLLSMRAAEKLKVILCGEGADELFGGYGRYAVARRLARNEGPAHGIARWWGGRRSGEPWARALEAALWGGGFRAHAALLDSDLALLEKVAPSVAGAYLDAAETDWTGLAAGASQLDAARLYDRERWLPNVYLEKTDRATMAYGLEGRLPFLDRIVAAAAPLPRPVGTRKAPLRELLAELLPEVRLPKRKLGLAVDIWGLRAAGLDAPFRAAVGSSTAVLGSTFGREAVSSLAQRAEKSPSLFFRLAMLGLWEEEFAGELAEVRH